MTLDMTMHFHYYLIIQGEHNNDMQNVRNKAENWKN